MLPLFTTVCIVPSDAVYISIVPPPAIGSGDGSYFPFDELIQRYDFFVFAFVKQLVSFVFRRRHYGHFDF